MVVLLALLCLFTFRFGCFANSWYFDIFYFGLLLLVYWFGVDYLGFMFSLGLIVF